VKLDKKVVLVTGASKGIGAAVVRDLASQGATVLLNYRSDDGAANEVKNSVEKAGGSVTLLKADVTNDSEVQAMFKTIQSDFGRIDVLVGNAGGLLGDDSIDDVDVFRSTFEVNLFSQVSMVKYCLPLMDEGKIVFMSSVHGGLGRGEGRVASYSAAKAALNSYMKNLAKELAPSILVNAVSPGRTATPAWGVMNPEEKSERGKGHATGRMLEPDEIASGVRFLIENDSMCGEILTIDGGMSITTLHS